MKNFLLYYLLLSALLFGQTEQDSIGNDLNKKKDELKKKSEEILDLNTNLTNQEDFISNLDTELDNLKEQNKNIKDSLSSEDIETNILKDVLKTVQDDKKLSQEMVQTIEQSENIEDTELQQDLNKTIQITDSEFRSIYNDGLNNYFNREYQESIKKFQYLLSLQINHNLTDNSMYWIGECYYSMDQYSKAIEKFEQTLPLGDGNKSDAALFKIGLSYLKMDDNDKAMAAFDKLSQKFPESDLVKKANEYLTNRKKF